MLREMQAVPLLSTLQSLLMPIYHIQGIVFVTHCNRDNVNMTILDLLELGGCDIRITKDLWPVVSSIKSFGFFEVGHTDLKQVTRAFFLVLSPISCLTDWATIRSRIACTAFVDARLITSRIGTGCHDFGIGYRPRWLEVVDG